MKKRQEIGRGLRLPVDQDGQRVFDESINKLFVMANESYEDFARALQTEYEEDCGVTFGKVPITAIAKHHAGRGRRGEARSAARRPRSSGRRWSSRRCSTPMAASSRPSTRRGRTSSSTCPKDSADLAPAVVDLLASYQIERHIRKDKDEGPNRLKKEVTLSPEFKALWDRIKPKTTYRVEFETDELVRARRRCHQDAWKRSRPPKIRVMAGQR